MTLPSESAQLFNADGVDQEPVCNERFLVGGMVLESKEGNSKIFKVITHDELLRETARDTVNFAQNTQGKKIRIIKGNASDPFLRGIKITADFITFKARHVQLPEELEATYSLRDGTLNEAITQMRCGKTNLINPPPSIPQHGIEIMLDAVDRISHGYAYSFTGINTIATSFEKFEILPILSPAIQK